MPSNKNSGKKLDLTQYYKNLENMYMRDEREIEAACATLSKSQEELEKKYSKYINNNKPS